MKKITSLTLLLSAFIVAQSNAQYIPQSVQLAHNSADTTISTLKIWVNDSVWVNSLSFQQATPKLTFATGVHTLGISLPSATSQAQSIAQHTFDFSQGIDSHFLIINGAAGGTAYPLFIQDYADQAVGMIAPNEAYFYLHNGCTSCGALSVLGSSSAQVTTITPVSAISYTNRGTIQVTAPSTFGPFNQNFTVTVNSGTVNYGTYTLPMPNYYQKFNHVLMNVSGAQAAKSTNKFKIAVVPETGGAFTALTELVSTTGINAEILSDQAISVFPNPVSDILYINFEQNSNKQVIVKVFSLDGKIVATDYFKPQTKQSSFSISTAELQPGVYILQTNDGNTTRHIKFAKY